MHTPACARAQSVLNNLNMLILRFVKPSDGLHAGIALHPVCQKLCTSKPWLHGPAEVVWRDGVLLGLPESLIQSAQSICYLLPHRKYTDSNSILIL